MRRGLVLFLSLVWAMGAQTGLNYESIAERIAASLQLRRGERVLVRADPEYFAGLVEPLRRRIRAARAVDLPLPGEQLTARSLDRADVLVRLPAGPSPTPLMPDEQNVLANWLAKGGSRRVLQLHWSDGDRRIDGLPCDHPPEFDALYRRALGVGPKELAAVQERAMAALLLGTVRMNTPAGTDFMFRIGVRSFNRQDGDASPARARAARLPADREIDLPAGGLVVAPIEQTAAGQIVIPEFHLGNTVARNVVVHVDNGRITGLRAAEGLEAVKAMLASRGEAASQFGGFVMGFNPALAVPAGNPVVPGLGYGAGVIRLGFGDNQDLGGNVRGSAMRWLTLTNASLHVDFRYLLRDGRLVLHQLPK